MKLRHKLGVGLAGAALLLGMTTPAEAFQDIVHDSNCPGSAAGQQLNLNNYSTNTIRVYYRIKLQSGKATTNEWRTFPGTDANGSGVPPRPNINVWSPRVWWFPLLPYDYVEYWISGNGTLDFNYRVYCV